MIIPCGHRLIVKPYKQEDVDDIMSKHKEFLKDFKIVNENKKREDASVDKGIVLAIGPTAWKSESFGFTPWCKVGDEIIFAKFSGKIVEDEELGSIVAINDEDVVAVTRQAGDNKEAE